MLEEIKRKEVDKRDKQLPQNFEQLIQMYDLDRIWDYFSKVVSFTNAIEEEVVNGHSVITLTLKSTVTNPVIEEYTKVPLSLKTKVGNKLSVSNNGVLIGSGVHHIKVSGIMGVDTGNNSSDRHIRIAKGTIVGDNNTIGWCTKICNSNSSDFLALPENIVPVNESDVISLFYYLKSGDVIPANANLPRTYLTIEVVD